ncbi:Acg family FMN-binding oxidoreductase [Nocardioides sp. GXZ039]|uniref:Acg family FMN-binding oxidoreductase n=1 Tax=Nocardioides sp. GXZ039 TaxID=3136018 RepID=UPI0030F4202C
MTATPVSTDPIGRPGPSLLLRLVELACTAPSTHNSQPWRWRLLDDGVELHTDPERRLRSIDPDDRDLVISCGAALHCAVVAARALGWDCEVSRAPYDGRGTLLARLRLSLRREWNAEGETALATLRARVTDRRRFTSWPVPSARLASLVRIARAHGARARVIDDAVARFRLERLVARAQKLQEADPAAMAEQRRWVGDRPCDGVPLQVVPAADPGRPVRFGPGLLDEPDRDVRGTDGVMVLGGAGDDDDLPAAWLRTGEALSALWLTATAEGLSVVPLSQPIEVAETRRTLRDAVLGGEFAPHLLVRLGWQAIGRSEIPHTPRRPVEDVLLP